MFFFTGTPSISRVSFWNVICFTCFPLEHRVFYWNTICFMCFLREHHLFHVFSSGTSSVSRVFYWNTICFTRFFILTSTLFDVLSVLTSSVSWGPSCFSSMEFSTCAVSFRCQRKLTWSPDVFTTHSARSTVTAFTQPHPPHGHPLLRLSSFKQHRLQRPRSTVG